MKPPTVPQVLTEAERSVRIQGRAALCQIVRTEGSSPGKPGWKLVVRADGTTFGNLGGGAFEALVKDDARSKLAEESPRSEVKRYYLTERATRGEATGMVCGGFVEVFLEVLASKPILVVCGGGPVGQALAHNAVLCDFELVVADDREEFRNPDLFPTGTELVAIDREHSSSFLEPWAGRDLYVAVVSRCWETDLAALASILSQKPRNLVYLGLMGSKRKVERVCKELLDAGLDPERYEFRAPIGLPIGADRPGELAVSILAEMIQLSRVGERSAASRDLSRSVSA